MHDSYQHHYLLSWLLAFAVSAPSLSVRDCSRREARMREPSLPLAALCCAIVYTFTAVSKTSRTWLEGRILQKLAHSGGPMAWAPDALIALGVGESSAWRFSALAIVLTQIVIAAGFVVSVYRDDGDGRWRGFTCAAALFAAWSFHVATELSPRFAIGWFSYYMLWVCAISLLPAHWLAWLLKRMATLRERTPLWNAGAREALLLAIACIAIGVLIVLRADLPGVAEGAALFTVPTLASALGAARRTPRKVALGRTLGAATALLALFVTLETSSVRFDYYRRAAGELARMGRTAEALELYLRAERHAPRGQTRRDKIDALRRQLGHPH